MHPESQIWYYRNQEISDSESLLHYNIKNNEKIAIRIRHIEMVPPDEEENKPIDVSKPKTNLNEDEENKADQAIGGQI